MGTGDAGVVVVVVVVLSGGTCGSLVVHGGANGPDGGANVPDGGANVPDGGAAMPDGGGSLVVAFDAVAPCTGALSGVVDGVVSWALGTVPVPSFDFVGGLAEPLGEDVGVGDGAVVDAGAVDMPGSGAPSPVDASGVVDPTEPARLGDIAGEPGLSATDERITTMPKADAIPIPLCRRLMFISNLNLKVDRQFASSGWNNP